MKRLMVIIDGMEDEKIPELDMMQPSRFANMPALNHMRVHGEVTYKNFTPSGLEPSTDINLLSILGYKLKPGYQSRSWLEALGHGIRVAPNDLCLRLNLIGIKNGLINSHCGYNLGNRESYAIMEKLRCRFQSDKIEFHHGGSFRNLMVIKDCNASLTALPPHEMIGKDKEALSITCDDKVLEKHLNKIIFDSITFLEGLPANGIALWAPGRPVSFIPKLKGKVVAASQLVKGIGKATGLEVMEVVGATADEHTDYKAKLDAAILALKDEDFVLLHLEAADEASHQRNPLKKVNILEEIDKKILLPLLHINENVEITVQSDHATSSVTGRHMPLPVEVINYHTGN